MEFFVNKVSKLWLRHVNELHKERVDLNVDIDSLGHNREQGNLFFDRPEVPRVIGEVSCL